MNRSALLGLAIAVCSFAVAGCSTSSGSGAGSDTDAGSCAPLDASSCGQPCQKGNSKGVGAFCSGLTCANNGAATLCANAGSPSDHFCTFMCSPADAGSGDAAPPYPTDCGEGAQCACQGGACGCIPNSCL
jgi:predicted small secreted protein